MMEVSSMKVVPPRLLSLDTLRGFDMFWITGGSKLIHALALVAGWNWLYMMDEQLTHPDWNGFHAYDLIFPLFIFMAGVSTPFSMDSRLAKGVSKNLLARKAVQRGLILILLGIVYNNGLFRLPWHEMRFASVLGRIGLAGMFAQLIYIYSSKRLLYVWFAAILIGYWVFMQYFPVPGCGAGLLTMDCNPASYLDQILLPGKLHKTIHDPEGLVSTIPAITTGLLGIFTGMFLRNKEERLTPNRKAMFLALSGVAFLILALVWDTVFPINKNIWSSSFVLFSGGWSLLLLALFYWVIDVLLIQKWTFFFVVIGMNSIVIYMSKKVFDFTYTADFFVGGMLGNVSESVSLLGGVIAFIAIQWVFMLVLYRNKWFLKV